MQIKGDFWVQHTQMWLNNTFGDHEEWVRLEEDGSTGTNTMQGLIRAFQIHNDISPSTGEVGPATRKKFEDLDEISKMDPDGKEDKNVYIIQGALFCKGYNAGGLTGIFYNAGVAAITEVQKDAYIEKTGVIGWKEWAALLSMNWFTLVEGGNPIVRTIQRQLNNEFSNQIGVGPCDGIVSRHTALSLIAALQAAEGIEVVDDINEVNFGDLTTARFPSPPLKIDQNTEYYKKFNRILQYGLYFNGCDPYRLDGIFDAKTQMSLNEFQQKHALIGSLPTIKQGICDVSTMKSLLTSKGDENRKAAACDCATILSKKQAMDLRDAGYTHVGRYLTGTVGVGVDERPKAITLDEISNIKSASLSLVPIYQDGGFYPEYFENSTQGTNDAKEAIRAALKLGISDGTTIYFAVDYDCYGYEIDENIIPYFKKINEVFDNFDYNIKNYKVGIYAPRYVCTKVSKKRLASTSFVCDMSTGFSGNLGFPIPDNWAFDQFHEFIFPSYPSFPLDKNAYSGKDMGCSNFDEPIDVLDESLLEILKSNSLCDDFGLFIDSPIGKKTFLRIGLFKFTYQLSNQAQLKDSYKTVDVKVEGDKIKFNGLTLEAGQLGISLTPDLELTLYAYLQKFDNQKSRLKFELSDEGVRIHLEFLHSISSNGVTYQVSDMFTLEINDFSLENVLDGIMGFYIDTKLANVLIMAVAAVLIATLILNSSIWVAIATVLSNLVVGILSILSTVPASDKEIK